MRQAARSGRQCSQTLSPAVAATEPPEVTEAVKNITNLESCITYYQQLIRVKILSDAKVAAAAARKAGAEAAKKPAEAKVAAAKTQAATAAFDTANSKLAQYTENKVKGEGLLDGDGDENVTNLIALIKSISTEITGLSELL